MAIAYGLQNNTMAIRNIFLKNGVCETQFHHMAADKRVSAVKH
jgi:hypothetical protein